MASDTVHVGQLICDSTTPPPDRGFYKINDTTTGHVGKLVMSDPVSGKESVALTATISDGGVEISIGGVGVPNVAYPALRAFKQSLNAGITAGVQVLTDSTGNDTFEWPYTFAQALAADYPAYTVRHILWDDTTQDYLAPTEIQTGPAGPRYMDLTLGAYPRKLAIGAAPHLTGIIDVRIDMTCEDWSPANAFGGTVLVGEGGGTGEWAWSLGLHTTGSVVFYYSEAGATTSSMNNFTTAGITDGSRSWIRAVFTPNDGAGNRTLKTYKSTDGINWTQIGATVTTAGAVVVKDQVAAGVPYKLGSHGQATQSTSIRIHEVQIRDGIGGPTITPRLPDGWGGYGALPTCEVYGAPVLTVVAGAKPGGNIAYLDDATRKLMLTPDYSQVLTILSCMHNETQKVGRFWGQTLAAWVSSVRARLGTGIAALTQNPQRPAALDPNSQARRRLELLGFGRGLGVDVVDTYAGFIANQNWQTEYMADDVHPNAAGALVTKNRLKAAFDAA